MKKRWMEAIVCLLVGQVQAASFDCGKAATKVEKLICADAVLSKLDTELAATYKAVLKNEYKSGQLREEQKLWLQKSRQHCMKINTGEVDQTECLLRAYRNRIKDLAPRSVPFPKPNREVQTQGDTGQDAWHCEQRSSKNVREWCEKARDALPYEFDIRSVGEGRGYTLCELFRKNIEALGELPHCGIKIHPKYQQYFSLPQWEDLDPWADEELLWQMEQAIAPGVPGSREIEKYTRDDWLALLKRRLLDENEYDGKLELKRSRFDLSGDGKAEWVLAYRVVQNPPCNIWVETQRGYRLFVLKEDGRALDLTRTRGFSTSNEYPFFVTLNDPRFRSDRSPPSGTSNHTYRLYASGIPPGHERGSFSIHGNYDTNGNGQVERLTACQYDIVKKRSKSTVNVTK